MAIRRQTHIRVGLIKSNAGVSYKTGWKQHKQTYFILPIHPIMAQSRDVNPYAGEPMPGRGGLMTPRDFEYNIQRRLPFTPPSTKNTSADIVDQRVNGVDTDSGASLSIIQQARFKLKRSLREPNGVSQVDNTITHRGRSSARAGGSDEVINGAQLWDSFENELCCVDVAVDDVEKRDLIDNSPFRTERGCLWQANQRAATVDPRSSTPVYVDVQPGRYKSGFVKSSLKSTMSKQAFTEQLSSDMDTAYIECADKPPTLVKFDHFKTPVIVGHRKLQATKPVCVSSSDTEDEVKHYRPREKRRFSFKPTTDSKPRCPIPNVSSIELQQLRNQNEQISQILQSLANRVDDLAENIPALSPTHPVVETQQTDQTDQLVTKMQAMIKEATQTKRKCVAKYYKASEQSSGGESDAETVSKRQLMRPMKFDGTGSFETFLAHFRNCSEHNKWNKSEQLSWLKCSLIKNAGQVLWDLSTDSTDTFQKLVDVLTNRFGGVKQTDKHRMELRYRKRRSNEALTDLHQDISRLMALAHPQLPSSSRDTIAVDYFIDSLNDADFALKVRERNPSSLDEALRVSLQLEAWIRDTNRSKIDDHTGGKTRMKEARGMVVAEKDNSTEISAIKTQVSSLGKQVSELCQNLKTQLTTNTKQMTELPSLQQNTTKSQVGNNMTNQSVRSKGCFYCHDPAHMRNNCPLLQPQAASNRQPVATNADRRGCYQCGELSHIVRNCPQLSNAGHTSNRQLRGSAVNDSCKVYINANVEDNRIVCLLDSGCEQTIMPLKLIKKCGYAIHHTDKTVRAANGTKLDLAGECKVALTLQHDTIFINALVSHDVEEVMLGYDFLVTNDCVWQFGSCQILIKGKSYTPFARKGPVTCRRVYVTSDIVIPPKQQVNLPVRSTINSLSECVGSFMIEPKTIQTGVYLGRTVLPAAHHDIVVRAINTMNEPRLVKKGSCLGTLTSICDPKCDLGIDIPAIPSKTTASETIINRLPTNLSDEQHRQTVDMLKSYEDIFSQNDYDIGRTHLVEHTIDTGDHKPIRQSLRRHPITHLGIIDQQVGEMLEHGIIEPAASPWSSNVVLAKKKDGSLRLCVDYRNLNQITYQDTYPLPHIETCLNTLQGAKWFTTLDLRSGYHNIPIKESDKDKTAFITRRGSWRYNVMPFGLTCAPSVFQRLMDLVLCGLTFEACMVYIDDIIIFSSDFETHISRLQQVFDRIRQAGLKLKASKCCLLQQKVEFLGHVVSANGLEVQEEKVSAVRAWPVPSNLHEVRSYVGFCSYYRRFIEGFSNIAAPLHALAKKSARFIWGPEQQEAFETLKERLITAPVLAMPIDDGLYYLDTDASDTGLGAVLTQVQDGVEKPVAFASRSLNQAERNYCTTRKELLAIIYGLKQYRQFLLGRPFIVRTDHSSLQWLRRTPEPVAQQARWLAFIEQFQYQIEHRPGHRHTNADALSRIPHPCKQCTHCDEESPVKTDNSTINVKTVVRSIVADLLVRRPDLGNSKQLRVRETSINAETVPDSAGIDIAKAQQEDPDIGFIVKLRLERDEQPSINELLSASATTKTLWSQWYRLVVRNGVVYKLWFSKGGEPNRLLLLAPRILREDIMKNSHGGMSGGHMGIAKTCDQVQRRAFWLGWRADVVRFCRRCVECCTYHRGQLPRNAQLQPIVCGAPFERMSIDLTGPHCRTPRGSVYILTCVDVFTKWTEAFPLPNKEAAVVARVLVEQVFCRFGTPIALLSDNGTEVDSSIMREICKLLGIDKLHTTAYKPSTNSAIERFHRTLNSMLGKVINEKQDNWDLMLPYVMAAYRSSRHDSTSYSPNMLMLSRENRAPVDLMYGTGDLSTESTNYDDFIETTRDRMSVAYDIVRQHIGEAAIRNKKYYDMRVRPVKYKVGDWVYYYNPRRYRGRQDKWARKYTGPFCVIKVPGPVNVQLQLNKRSRPFIAHIDKVKPFLGEKPANWVNDVEQTPAEFDESHSENAVLNVPSHQEICVDEHTPNISHHFTDVITLNKNQEFRRNRPRRQVVLPARLRD